ncbi:MAG: carbon-nitrogen hydrolase family protein [Planctomycetes bacterium]|nr:carbon-nitrogen hydrolase family protein [Planctomycetota bacterium]
MSRQPFKAALVQMRVEGGRPEANLVRAAERIAEAAGAGARLVLLPETMDLGWTDPSARDLAEPVPDGRTCTMLREAARANRIYVCSGLTERTEGAVYNAAVLVDPRGEVLLLHRKLHELEIAHGLYAQGDRLGACRTELGMLGLVICADGFARHQALTRSLGYMGAEVILAPCAWAVPTDYDNVARPYGDLWRESLGPVAGDFSLWVLAASNVGVLRDGPWGGRPCIGCSMVFGPDGHQVLQGPYGPDAETILYVDVTPTPRPARGHGWEDWWKTRPSPPAAS